jgi:hypothetical protein
MVAWDHKQCKCKLCSEAAKNNGGKEVQIFDSVSMGKTHLFHVHRIPYAKARDYLELTSENKEKIIKLGVY